MIKVENDWVIESDGMQYILKERTYTYDKHGRELFKTPTYYHSVEDALKGYARYKQLNFVKDNDMSVAQAIMEFKKINDDLEKIVRVNG